MHACRSTLEDPTVAEAHLALADAEGAETALRDLKSLLAFAALYVKGGYNVEVTAEDTARGQRDVEELERRISSLGRTETGYSEYIARGRALFPVELEQRIAKLARDLRASGGAARGPDESSRLALEIIATKSAMERFRMSLLEGSPLDRTSALDLARQLDFTMVRDSERGLVRNEIADAARMSDGRVLLRLRTLRQDESGAYAHQLVLSNLETISVGPFPTQPEALWHELGHQLEQVPRIASAARAWVLSRAQGPIAPMDEIYPGSNFRPEEQGVRGPFARPYVGRLYDSGKTEVCSVGLEHFVSSSKMLELLLADPDHFFFVLGVLKDP